MKTNELIIEIPEGKVIDWEESKKQNRIVFKNEQLTYEEICKKLFIGKDFYFICGTDSIVKGKAAPDSDITRFLLDANNAPSKHQLECILAKNKLANVAKYLNNGWKPSSHELVYYITVYLINDDNKYSTPIPRREFFRNSFCVDKVIFKSEELAQQAIEILGEETVKLALEPLGI